MVLNSQTPRAGMSRMYMSSRPRHGLRWRWAAAIALALVLMYVFFWSSQTQEGPVVQGADSPALVGTAGPASAQASTSTDSSTGTRGPRSASELPPPRGLSNPPSQTPASGPVVQTLTIGQTGVDSAGPTRSTPTAKPRPAPPLAQSSATAGSQLARGMAMIREGRLVQGRRELSQLLFAEDGQLSPLDAQTVRDTLSSINQQLVFSAEVIPGDPLAESYMVQRGEYLSKIAPGYGLPYQFVERINKTPAERLQAGKAIKVIKGPFHGRVSKSEYRLDIYLNDSDGQPIFVRSFPVGLGKTDSTPQGSFIVEPGRKVTNPDWRNPRTGEYFGRDDPKNPIGEYWIALRGNEPATESFTGYGLHGTIDPQSIGQQASMGCIRMRKQDVKLVYDMLAGGQSTVQIGW
jgi:lipoprotein-anchoring transpeptidase ErfK/SrfK